MVVLDQRGVELAVHPRLELRQGVGRHLEAGSRSGRTSGTSRTRRRRVEEGRVVRRQLLRGQVLAGLGFTKRDPGRRGCAGTAQCSAWWTAWTSGTRSSRFMSSVPSWRSRPKARRSLSSESWSQRWTWPTKRSWKPITSGRIDLAVPHRCDRAARSSSSAVTCHCAPGSPSTDRPLPIETCWTSRLPARLAPGVPLSSSRTSSQVVTPPPASAIARPRASPRRPGRPGACRGGGDRGQACAAAAGRRRRRRRRDRHGGPEHRAEPGVVRQVPRWSATPVPRSAANAPVLRTRAGQDVVTRSGEIEQPRREIFTRAAQYRPACSRGPVRRRAHDVVRRHADLASVGTRVGGHRGVVHAVDDDAPGGHGGAEGAARDGRRGRRADLEDGRGPHRRQRRHPVATAPRAARREPATALPRRSPRGWPGRSPSIGPPNSFFVSRHCRACTRRNGWCRSRWAAGWSCRRPCRPRCCSAFPRGDAARAEVEEVAVDVDRHAAPRLVAAAVQVLLDPAARQPCRRGEVLAAHRRVGPAVPAGDPEGVRQDELPRVG